MCYSAEIIQFCIQLIRVHAENSLKAKMLSDEGDPSIHVVLRGVSVKFCFDYAPYMMACFHEHLALEL